MTFPVDPSSGAINQGPPPLYTPDQLLRLRGLVGRSPFYVRDNTFLRVLVMNSLVGQTVLLTGDFRLIDGTRKPISISLTPDALRSYLNFTLRLGEGFLFSLTAKAGTALCNLGTLYVLAQVMAGDALVEAQGVTTLFAGWCTAAQFLSWPYASTPVTTRPPQPLTITPTVPAPGTDWTYTVPTNAAQELLAIRAQFAASAAVANRATSVVVQVTGVNAYIANFATNITAGQVVNFGVGPTLENRVDTNGPFATMFTAPLPPQVVLQPGDIVQSVTTSLQAADQFSNIALLMRDVIRVQ